MKLSEAIRLGAMNRRQAYGHYYASGGTCALGAAIDAHGQLTTSTDDLTYNAIIRRLYPEVVNDKYLQCPACFQRSHASVLRPIKSVVVHLNDHHHWTREAIADWIEALERDEVTAQEVSPQQSHSLVTV